MSQHSFPVEKSGLSDKEGTSDPEDEGVNLKLPPSLGENLFSETVNTEASNGDKTTNLTTKIPERITGTVKVSSISTSTSTTANVNSNSPPVTSLVKEKAKRPPKLIVPGSFDPENHFYPKVTNASISYVVSNFLELGNERIISRYCHLNPKVNEKKLKELLEYKPRFFKWSGSDLFPVTNSSGKRQMVLIETNSCPSGMKSMPSVVEKDEMGSYRVMMEATFKPWHDEVYKAGKLPDGVLCVLYDKNAIESSGYACAMADVFDEKVYLVEYLKNEKSSNVRFTKDLIMEILIDPNSDSRVVPNGTNTVGGNVSNVASTSSTVSNNNKLLQTSATIATSSSSSSSSFSSSSFASNNIANDSNIGSNDSTNEKHLEQNTQELKPLQWIPVRAVFRYVTQKPWNRIPLVFTKTLIFNPVIACIAGGRNKLLASKAYDFFNAEMGPYGLNVLVPKTIHDVEKPLVPLWVQTLGGFAVVKNPYSNAGQGVWTITSKEELADFMKIHYEYEQFIVQSLIGNHKWSSDSQVGRLYHIGTVPDKRDQFYVADLRMMIHYNYKTNGFAPIAMYARKALEPLSKTPPRDSWSVLGTNLSYKKQDGTWETDTKRLIICAQNSFNKLGLGLDDLINGYVQSVFATVAIDKMACNLIQDGRFNMEIFSSLNKDLSLIREMNEKFNVNDLHE